MTPKERAFAAQLLKLAADEFGNHGCNDLDWPQDWTEAERSDFTRRYHEFNGEADDTPYAPLGDFAAMEFIAHLLLEEDKS